jgi:hypothetical protein
MTAGPKDGVLLAVLSPPHAGVSFEWACALMDVWERLPTSSARIRVTSYSVDLGRERACLTALEGGFPWLWFLDGDTLPPPDAFAKMAARGVDIISGVVHRKDTLNCSAYRKTAEWTPEDLMYDAIVDLPETEQRLAEVDGLATACLLIRTETLRKIERPWFRYGPDSLVELSKDALIPGPSEDIYFSAKAQAAGVTLYVDPQVRCGHEGRVAIMPYDNVPSGNHFKIRPGLNVHMSETSAVTYFPSKRRWEAP